MNIKVCEMIGRLTVEACEKDARILELEEQVKILSNAGGIISGSGGDGIDGAKGVSKTVISHEQQLKKLAALASVQQAINQVTSSFQPGLDKSVKIGIEHKDNPNNIDYKSLLERYMGHIIGVAGHSYTSFTNQTKVLSELEFRCLNKINEELVDDEKKKA